jgi:hypothetical protein
MGLLPLPLPLPSEERLACVWRTVTAVCKNGHTMSINVG